MKQISIAIATIISLAIAVPAISQNQGSQKKQQSSKIPAGFGALQWGMSVNDAKSKVIGKITYIDEKRVILTRDNNIRYSYGFFHIDPAIAGSPAGKSGKAVPGKKGGGKSPQPSASQQPKLYYVLIQFPYLRMDDVKKKIVDKYGPPSGENIKKNQGAFIWDSEHTSIVMWVDRYEKLPFCRKITYLGKKLGKEVNEYQKRIFNKNEIEILRNLNP